MGMRHKKTNHMRKKCLFMTLIQEDAVNCKMKKKKKNYLGANVKCYVTYLVTNTISDL